MLQNETLKIKLLNSYARKSAVSSWDQAPSNATIVSTLGWISSISWHCSSVNEWLLVYAVNLSTACFTKVSKISFGMKRTPLGSFKNWEIAFVCKKIIENFLFSNFFKLLLTEIWKIKITVWKNDNLTMYGNFCLDFESILLHIKRASKKIWHLAQGRVLDPCLGPYICISISTK